MTVRAISYGGGVQSTALVVLAARREINFPLAIFSNVGDDSEHPATLSYVREIAVPWASERGVEIVEVVRSYRDGTPYPSLLEYHRENVHKTGATPLPVKMGEGIANRTCTAHWKAQVVSRVLRARGATVDTPADLALGISVDEMHRATNKRDRNFENRVFPLLDLGMTRRDCESVIRSEGLPVPPKSACWYCPFTPARRWAEIRRDDPSTFEAVADLEDELLDERARHGKRPFYWTDRLKPMRVAIPIAQDTLPGLEPESESCDDGYCFT